MSRTYLATRVGRGIVQDTWADADGGESAEERAERRARGIVSMTDLPRLRTPAAKPEPKQAIITRRGAGGPVTIDRRNPPKETPDYPPAA